MSRLPRLTGKDLLSALKRAGFEIHHQRGSHITLKNEAGDRATVPVHAGKTIKPKTLKSILKDAKLSTEDLIRLI